jgi:uncharacterized protein YlxW (UPF0749 family)
MRDVYMPWVSCRCSLYTLLIFMPLTMTIIELIGIFQYKNYWEKQQFWLGFYVMFGISILVATFFQVKVIVDFCRVRKMISGRERRVQQQLIRLEQEDAYNLLRQVNRVSARLAHRQLLSNTEQI